MKKKATPHLKNSSTTACRNHRERDIYKIDIVQGETVASFVNPLKTDIRFVNSYKWAEPLFRILPISALYRSFWACQ